LYRDKIDTSYQIETNTFYYEAGDSFKFNVEVMTLYIDLDNLIKECSFTNRQKTLLEYFFNGYSISDINRETGISRSSVSKSLDIITDKIVSKNNQKWSSFTKKYLKSVQT
jgi:DNA-binding NarL/FixJ family response regulator